ncbi:hypothetical protein [Shimia sp.]|uniref:hypothetical protein n=1 Tax=Shimia sp. TaxID=1954381 RepID=UPI00329A7994
MTLAAQKRGAAPVGYLGDLDPIEVGAVRGLRAWSNGPDGIRQYEQSFGDRVDRKTTHVLCQSLTSLCDLCYRHGRRPLMRHHTDCKCLGADESCFANFVAAATAGQREDAMLMACLIVRPDFAPSLIGLAEKFGVALARTALLKRPPHKTKNVIQFH